MKMNHMCICFNSPNRTFKCFPIETLYFSQVLSMNLFIGSCNTPQMYTPWKNDSGPLKWVYILVEMDVLYNILFELMNCFTFIFLMLNQRLVACGFNLFCILCGLDSFCQIGSSCVLNVIFKCFNGNITKIRNIKF